MEAAANRLEDIGQNSDSISSSPGCSTAEHELAEDFLLRLGLLAEAADGLDELLGGC